MMGEKPFLPLEYGAITAYHGNGQRWMDMYGVNRKKNMIDREDFKSDEEFAYGIVALLKDSARLELMQAEPVFFDPVNIEKKVRFFTDPKRVGNAAFPEISEYVRSSPRFKNMLDRPLLTYVDTRWDTRSLGADLLATIFNATKVVKCPATDEEFADVEMYMCCGW